MLHVICIMENWHFEEKSGKIEIIKHNLFNNI